MSLDNGATDHGIDSIKNGDQDGKGKEEVRLHWGGEDGGKARRNRGDVHVGGG